MGKRKNNKSYDRNVGMHIKNKDTAMQFYREMMLNKTSQMFKYDGLPDSIPAEILEQFLQENGNVFFHEVEGELYVFTGGLGGEPDVYYRPTIYTIANPALKYSKNAEIDKDGILMKNDDRQQGLLPIINKFGSLMTEIIISIHMTIINTRHYNTIVAGTDKSYKSAKEYQKQIEMGNLAIISSNSMMHDDDVYSLNTRDDGSNMGQLREQYQFLESKLYSDLGIKTSHNMKRQYVSNEENIANDDTLLPLVDNMLENRRRALEKVNDMFDTNISVELDGLWKVQYEEIEKEIELAELPLEYQIEGEDIDENNPGENRDIGTEVENTIEPGDNDGDIEARDDSEHEQTEDEDSTEEGRDESETTRVEESTTIIEGEDVDGEDDGDGEGNNGDGESLQTDGETDGEGHSIGDEGHGVEVSIEIEGDGVEESIGDEEDGTREGNGSTDEIEVNVELEVNINEDEEDEEDEEGED